MFYRFFGVFLVVLSLNCLEVPSAKAGILKSFSNFTSRFATPEPPETFQPYLEDSRHLQVPQWAHEDWYVEDWTVQQDGMTLIQGFYAADILRDQTVGHADLPVLVVGPNFYRLSGFDKRRVVHTVDVTYGLTDRKENAAFMLTDWYTKKPIGMFDKTGLRLH